MDTLDQNPQNRAPGEHGGDNRPRLRKIKRPKQHSGPIQNRPQPDMRSNFNTNRPKNEQEIASHASHEPLQRNQPISSNDLIRAADNPVYNQGSNNFSAPNYITNVDDDDVFAYQEPESFSQNSMADNKKTIIIACVCVVIGLILGNFMFSNETVVRDGLQGVIVNPEVPKGRSRCGIAEKTQGCVLYIMNPQRNELNGRDFYDLAAQLTGRQRFVIETGNMRYSTVKIKPGNIAQLNSPPLQ